MRRDVVGGRERAVRRGVLREAYNCICRRCFGCMRCVVRARCAVVCARVFVVCVCVWLYGCAFVVRCVCAVGLYMFV